MSATIASTYKKGAPMTGAKTHAVRPGSEYKANPTLKLGVGLCGAIVRPDAGSFDPTQRQSCQRCSASVRRLRGPGA